MVIRGIQMNVYKRVQGLAFTAMLASSIVMPVFAQVQTSAASNQVKSASSQKLSKKTKSSARLKPAADEKKSVADTQEITVTDTIKRAAHAAYRYAKNFGVGFRKLAWGIDGGVKEHGPRRGLFGAAAVSTIVGMKWYFSKSAVPAPEVDEFADLPDLVHLAPAPADAIPAPYAGGARVSNWCSEADLQTKKAELKEVNDFDAEALSRKLDESIALRLVLDAQKQARWDEGRARRDRDIEEYRRKIAAQKAQAVQRVVVAVDEGLQGCEFFVVGDEKDAIIRRALAQLQEQCWDGRDASMLNAVVTDAIVDSMQSEDDEKALSAEQQLVNKSTIKKKLFQAVKARCLAAGEVFDAENYSSGEDEESQEFGVFLQKPMIANDEEVKEGGDARASSKLPTFITGSQFGFSEFEPATGQFFNFSESDDFQPAQVSLSLNSDGIVEPTLVAAGASSHEAEKESDSDGGQSLYAIRGRMVSANAAGLRSQQNELPKAQAKSKQTKKRSYIQEQLQRASVSSESNNSFLAEFDNGEVFSAPMTEQDEKEREDIQIVTSKGAVEQAAPDDSNFSMAASLLDSSGLDNTIGDLSLRARHQRELEAPGSDGAVNLQDFESVVWSDDELDEEELRNVPVNTSAPIADSGQKQVARKKQPVKSRKGGDGYNAFTRPKMAQSMFSANEGVRVGKFAVSTVPASRIQPSAQRLVQNAQSSQKPHGSDRRDARKNGSNGVSVKLQQSVQKLEEASAPTPADIWLQSQVAKGSSTKLATAQEKTAQLLAKCRSEQISKADREAARAYQEEPSRPMGFTPNLDRLPVPSFFIPEQRPVDVVSGAISLSNLPNDEEDKAVSSQFFGRRPRQDSPRGGNTSSQPRATKQPLSPVQEDATDGEGEDALFAALECSARSRLSAPSRAEIARRQVAEDADRKEAAKLLSEMVSLQAEEDCEAMNALLNASKENRERLDRKNEAGSVAFFVGDVIANAAAAALVESEDGAKEHEDNNDLIKYYQGQAALPPKNKEGVRLPTEKTRSSRGYFSGFGSASVSLSEEQRALLAEHKSVASQQGVNTPSFAASSVVEDVPVAKPVQALKPKVKDANRTLAQRLYRQKPSDNVAELKKESNADSDPHGCLVS